MAREWIVVWAGRHRRDRWDALCEDYRERLDRFMPARELAVRHNGRRRAPAPVRSASRPRARRFCDSLPDPCRLIALDRDARPFSSEMLAELLVSTRAPNGPTRWFSRSDRISVRPGGPRPSLAAALLRPPHLAPPGLARLVLWEQLYRASAIATGSGYHRKSAGSLV